MKIYVLVFVLFLPLLVQAQCKGIKTRIDERRATTIHYSSYSLPVGIEQMVTATTDSLFIVCNINDMMPRIKPNTLKVTFSDGTSYENKDQFARMNYYNDKFYYTCQIPMADDSLRKLFLNKDITMIHIGPYKREVKKVEAEALHRYLVCMLGGRPASDH